MDTLDSDLLRTFLAVTQAGSVTDGAGRIHRSQSATSLQIKRLESTLGQPVFERHGRGVVLSDAGRRLLPIAQDVIASLDAALSEISGNRVTGRLRIGIPDDHGKEKLSEIIAAFTRQHPHVELEVHCALSAGFPGALKSDALDLAIYEVQTPAPHEELLMEDPTCWMMSAHADFSSHDRLPVALFDHACWWRETAIQALEKCGQPYRITYSSQSVSGIVAAVEAGVAVGLLARSSLRPGLSIVPQSFGLHSSPTSKLVIAANSSADPSPILAMKAAIRGAFLTQ